MLHPFARWPRDGLDGQGPKRSPEARLAEAVSLGRSIGLDVVASAAVACDTFRPATLFGRGRVETCRELVADTAADLVVIDATLSPVQQRNLERAWRCKVVDRTGLILEIFGARARTREGRLQVELARLSYQRSRLVRSWTHLERQRGGFGFLGGPGESQIESDRRQIAERIVQLRGELDGVRRTRGLHRDSRRRVPYPAVALVGYTNAGKSTLFNRLTSAGAVADDRMFATLDPTMRGVSLPSGRRIILSDTVGFVSKLPTSLVAAFSATLEEVREADLVVHVRDLSHPDHDVQKEDVQAVLREIAPDRMAAERMIEVLNKLDLLDPAMRAQALAQVACDTDRVALSARTGEGCAALLRRIDERLAADERLIELKVALADGAALAWLYRHGRVMARTDGNRFATLTVALSAADLGCFQRRAGDRSGAIAAR